MFNRIISHDTFGIVKVGNDAIGDTKLAIRFCQFPLSSTKKIDKRNLKKKKKIMEIHPNQKVPKKYFIFPTRVFLFRSISNVSNLLV